MTIRILNGILTNTKIFWGLSKKGLDKDWGVKEGEKAAIEVGVRLSTDGELRIENN